MSCDHPTLIGDLCLICGAKVDIDKEDYVRNTAVDESGLAISASSTNAHLSSSQILEKLHEDRKLILILDIDHTMLHAQTWSRLPQIAFDNKATIHHHNLERYSIYEEGKCVYGKSVDSFDDDRVVHGLRLGPATYSCIVKLRPGLVNFLKSLEPICDFYIVTMGVLDYGKAVARLLNLALGSSATDGPFKLDRIRSRYDYEQFFSHKDLNSLFSFDDDCVIVLDDDSSVWQFKTPLLKVEPFVWWGRHMKHESETDPEEPPTKKKPLKTAAQINPPSTRAPFPLDPTLINKYGKQCFHPLSPRNRPIADDLIFTQQLKAFQKIIMNSQEQYYLDRDIGLDAGVSAILDICRGSILRGCKILLPKRLYVHENSSRDLYECDMLITQFGGTPVHSVDAEYTHVLTLHGSEGSKLVADKGKAKLVHVSWLFHSCWTFHRKDEADYAVL